MAILWLLLLAFKNLEKSLNLSQTEQAIELDMDRGDRQMKSLIKITGFFIFLVGCGGGAQNLLTFDPALKAHNNYDRCVDKTVFPLRPGDYEQKIIEPSDAIHDPRKLRSVESITDEYKAWISAIGTPIRKCQNEAIEDLSRVNQPHTKAMVDYANGINQLIVDVLDGNVTTFGALNTRFANIATDAIAQYQYAASLSPDYGRNLLLDSLMTFSAISQAQYQAQMNTLQQFQANNAYKYRIEPTRYTRCEPFGEGLSCTSSSF